MKKESGEQNQKVQMSLSEQMNDPYFDPRVAATDAVRSWRQSDIGHAETVIGSTHKQHPMTEGKTYSV